MKYAYLAAASLAAVLWSGSASAIVALSRTSDYTVTFSDPNTFAGASAHYGLSFAYDAQAATTSVFTLQLLGNATNLTYNSGGGITINAPPAGPPYPATTPVDITDDGSAGYWGATYDTAATGSGPVLTYGTQGGLNTLNFVGGGAVSGPGYTDIQYYIYAHLPGDYTTAGTSTGDYQYNGVGAGFSTPTFAYDPATMETTVFTSNPDYSGTPTNLDFTLFGGAAVPEPGAWAMMLVGFAGLGWAARRQRTGLRAV